MLIGNFVCRCYVENCQLKDQLEQYEETLEKSETRLKNIQAYADREENNWNICLKSLEQKQEKVSIYFKLTPWS